MCSFPDGIVVVRPAEEGDVDYAGYGVWPRNGEVARTTWQPGELLSWTSP